MKKTQKVLDSLQFIEKLNLNSDELDRLMSELDDMLIEKEKQEELEKDEEYEEIYDPARDNARAVFDNIM